MNKKSKSALYFLATLLFFIVAFVIPAIFVPVPDKFKEIMTLDPQQMKLFFPLLFIFAVYISIAYGLLIRNTHQKKTNLFFKLVLANLIIFPLMGFLESFFWIDALKGFKGIESSGLVSLFYPLVITYIVFSAFLVLVMEKPQSSVSTMKTREGYKQIGTKILIIGLFYFIIYNLAGYFIAWQFEATRIYYTGSIEIKGFFQAMLQNISDPKFVIVHTSRGILFGIAGYLLYSLLNCSRNRVLIILALIFGGFGFQIILPNPLFPEMVRFSHFLETTSSMIVFGFFAGFIFMYKDNKMVSNK